MSFPFFTVDNRAQSRSMFLLSKQVIVTVEIIECHLLRSVER